MGLGIIHILNNLDVIIAIQSNFLVPYLLACRLLAGPLQAS